MVRSGTGSAVGGVVRPAVAHLQFLLINVEKNKAKAVFACFCFGLVIKINTVVIITSTSIYFYIVYVLLELLVPVDVCFVPLVSRLLVHKSTSF